LIDQLVDDGRDRATLQARSTRHIGSRQRLVPPDDAEGNAPVDVARRFAGCDLEVGEVDLAHDDRYRESGCRRSEFVAGPNYMGLPSVCQDLAKVSAQAFWPFHHDGQPIADAVYEPVKWTFRVNRDGIWTKTRRLDAPADCAYP
jgi:hypothetical protein